MIEKLNINYYGLRPIQSVAPCEDDKHQDLVKVTFADSLEPKFEVMHQEELEGMKSDKPLEGLDLDGRFSKSTQHLQERLINVFNDWNIRFTDLEQFNEFVKQIFEAAKAGLYCRIFNVEEFDNINFAEIEKALEDNGIELVEVDKDGKESQLSEVATELRGVYKRLSLKRRNINQSIMIAHNQYVNALELAIPKLIEKITGIPYGTIRLADLTSFYEKSKTADAGGMEGEKPEQSSDTDQT